jgi:hypothetical protein
MGFNMSSQILARSAQSRKRLLYPIFSLPSVSTAPTVDEFVIKSF